MTLETARPSTSLDRRGRRRRDRTLDLWLLARHLVDRGFPTGSGSLERVPGGAGDVRRITRFDQHLAGARLEGARAVALAGRAGDDNDRNRSRQRIRAQHAAEREPVDPAQVRFGDDEIRPPGNCAPERDGTVVRFLDVVQVRGKYRAVERARIGIRVHDQDRGPRGELG